jgi:hypothetical protein
MKKIVLIITVALLSLLLVACQKTPNQAVVQGKSLDKMIQAATTTSPGASGAQATGELAQRIGAEPGYQTELTDKGGKLKIHVNADVSVPNADSLPVMRVEKDTFSQSTVDILRQQLVHGDMFSGEDYKPTKDDIQKQINALEAELAQNGGTAPTPGMERKSDSGSLEATKARPAQLQSQLLDDLKQKLANAPDTSVKTPSTGKLAPFNTSIAGEPKFGDQAGQRVYGLAQSDQNGYESFIAANCDNEAPNTVNYTREKNGFSKNMGNFLTKDAVAAAEAAGLKTSITSSDIAQIPDIKITADEAKQKAETLITALGIKDLTMYSEDKEYGGSQDTITGMPVIGTTNSNEYVNPRQCVWFLRYVRNVNGIPLTYTNFDCMKIEDEAQTAPWSYEDMTFAVGDSGIVGFYWTSPYKITDTVTQNSNVMSFKDAMNVFNTMALVTNNFDSMAAGSSVTAIDINVKHIKFGLTRITEQDKRNSGLLVPCWDFIGDTVVTTDGKTKTKTDANEPILTVNAIDGSVINRSLGY